jgi:hypothetical protein
MSGRPPAVDHFITWLDAAVANAALLVATRPHPRSMGRMTEH